MNGGRTEYNNWELDGGDNMDNAAMHPQRLSQPEAIAEFKFSPPTTERSTAAMARALLKSRPKSGGASFHGSAFEYLRNEFFNAKSWDQGIDPTQQKLLTRNMIWLHRRRTRLRSNHYNADKKKTFFFFPRNGAAKRTLPRLPKTFPRI